MYRCDVCSKLVGPRKEEIKIITKTRKKTYFNVIKKFDKKTHKKIEIPKKSSGWEIVEEKSVCSKCKRLFDKEKRDNARKFT